MPHPLTSSCVEELLDAIYACALESNRWPAALDRLASDFDADAALLVVEDLRATAPLTWATSSLLQGRFAERYVPRHRVNPWVLAAKDRPFPSVARTESLVPEEVLRASSFYRECLEPHDLLHSLGANLFLEDGVFAYFGMLRGAKRGPFDDDALVDASRFVGHIGRALRLKRCAMATTVELGVLTAILDRVPQPIVLFDRSAQLLHANPAALAILDRNDGLSVSRGRIIARDRSANRELSLRMARAASGEEIGALAPLRIPRTGEARAYSLWICLVSGELSPDAGHFAAFLSDPSRTTRFDREAIRATFMLTSRELDVATLLARGQQPAEIAEALALSVNTVKTHVSRLFAKTGTRRQAELVAQLLVSST